MLIRINKYLANIGISSRRKIDTLIYQSRITVNGVLALPGQKIDPSSDSLKIDGKLVQKYQPDLEYIILNKPRKVLSTTKDDKGRNTVLKYVDTPNRLYPVGRLDNESTGLIILTNDGDLTQLMTHPKFHLPKTYLVSTSSKVDQDHIQKIRQGIAIDGIVTKPAIVNLYSKNANMTTLKITLFEGRNRQIRKMFKLLKLDISSLHRISIGQIHLGHLKPGQSRPMTLTEIKLLKTPVNTGD